MLTKTKMQEIQDLKLQGYTKGRGASLPADLRSVSIMTWT